MICPSGGLLKGVSIPLCKNISLNPSGKSSLQARAIPPHRGALAIVTNAGKDAVDAAASGARRDAGRVRRARERSNGELTNGADAYGEVVWS